MNFDAFVVFIDSLSYGPLVRRPYHLLYSLPRTKASAGLRFSPFAYSEDNNRQISQRPHFPISSSLDSHCTPQFCYLGNSSTLLILVVLRSSQRFVGTPRHNYPSDHFPLTVIIPVLGLVQRLDFASTSIVRRVAALTPRLTLS